MIPIVLTIAGSDSSARAGIQADLKAISANGGYGLRHYRDHGANTRGVTAAVELDLDLIRRRPTPSSATFVFRRSRRGCWLRPR